MKKLQATSKVDDEGVITLAFDTRTHNVSITFNQEFEYKEDGDKSGFESNYENPEADLEGGENEAEADAYHEFTATFKVKGTENGLKLQGSIILNGDCEIDSIVPISNGKDLREIATADLTGT